ncbi:MAG: hypothetical protein ACNI27_06495 [Desulfovibrio sp.]
MKRLLTSFLTITTILSFASISYAEMTKVQKATALIESIENGDPHPVSYINPNKYIQHNLSVEDGLAGFSKVLKALPKGSAKAKVVRAFEDGDYAITHTIYDFFGPQIGIDIFRFEDGLIVEHWDNSQPIETAPNPSGRTQTDGPAQVKDLEKTKQNKVLVKSFVSDVLMGKSPEKITEYIAPDYYTQHNIAVGDGLSALGKALEEMAKAGKPMTYTKNHMILGQGNFVLSVSEGQFFGKHTAFYDLFRVENNMLVEHWDTIEEIPAKSEWKNTNGKF